MRRYLIIGVVAFVLGFLLVLQIRVNMRVEQGVPAGRMQQLTTELRELQRENARLYSELNDLNEKLTKVNEGQLQAVQAVLDELNKARLVAGLVAVSGPGVEVVIDSPPGSQPPGANMLLPGVRDEDLLRVINELNAAGAEALALNEQRVVATSEIRLAGSIINVNTVRIVPPYHIKAIGKKEALKSALEIPNGVVDYLRELGMQVRVEAKDRIDIPAYTGRLDFRYSQEVH